MLLIETLRNKSDILVNNELIKDMTAKSVEYNGDYLVSHSVIVDDDLVMRPDLLAKFYYKNSNKLDYLLKFNGISNPFSLNSGDIILIPYEEDMKVAMKPKTSANAGTDKNPSTTQSEVAKKFFDPNRLSKKDQKRLEYLKEKAAQFQNPSGNNLPPNFAEPGAQELTVKDGKVVFGADVVATKDNCPDPLSKARAKQKLLERAIFKNTR